MSLRLTWKLLVAMLCCVLMSGCAPWRPWGSKSLFHRGGSETTAETKLDELTKDEPKKVASKNDETKDAAPESERREKVGAVSKPGGKAAGRRFSLNFWNRNSGAKSEAEAETAKVQKPSQIMRLPTPAPEPAPQVAKDASPAAPTPAKTNVTPTVANESAAKETPPSIAATPKEPTTSAPAQASPDVAAIATAKQVAEAAVSPGTAKPEGDQGRWVPTRRRFADLPPEKTLPTASTETPASKPTTESATDTKPNVDVAPPKTETVAAKPTEPATSKVEVVANAPATTKGTEAPSAEKDASHAENPEPKTADALVFTRPKLPAANPQPTSTPATTSPSIPTIVSPPSPAPSTPTAPQEATVASRKSAFQPRMTIVNESAPPPSAPAVAEVTPPKPQPAAVATTPTIVPPVAEPVKQPSPQVATTPKPTVATQPSAPTAKPLAINRSPWMPPGSAPHAVVAPPVEDPPLTRPSPSISSAPPVSAPPTPKLVVNPYKPAAAAPAVPAEPPVAPPAAPTVQIVKPELVVREEPIPATRPQFAVAATPPSERVPVANPAPIGSLFGNTITTGGANSAPPTAATPTIENIPGAPSSGRLFGNTITTGTAVAPVSRPAMEPARPEVATTKPEATAKPKPTVASVVEPPVVAGPSLFGNSITSGPPVTGPTRPVAKLEPKPVVVAQPTIVEAESFNLPSVSSKPPAAALDRPVAKIDAKPVVVPTPVVVAAPIVEEAEEPVDVPLPQQTLLVEREEPAEEILQVRAAPQGFARPAQDENDASFAPDPDKLPPIVAARDTGDPQDSDSLPPIRNGARTGLGNFVSAASADEQKLPPILTPEEYVRRRTQRR